MVQLCRATTTTRESWPTSADPVVQRTSAPRQRRFIVCSGGGPGIMEAANRGASERRGISHRAGDQPAYSRRRPTNPYITRELSFEFHYFFTRKFWFVYLAKALVVFPGGFGTMDELFELLTLIQTGKLGKAVPVVLYGKEFWDDAINLEALVRWGTISADDLKLYHVASSPEDAFEFLKDRLTQAISNPSSETRASKGRSAVERVSCRALGAVGRGRTTTRDRPEGLDDPAGGHRLHLWPLVRYFLHLFSLPSLTSRVRLPSRSVLAAVPSATDPARVSIRLPPRPDNEPSRHAAPHDPLRRQCRRFRGPGAPGRSKEFEAVASCPYHESIVIGPRVVGGARVLE